MNQQGISYERVTIIVRRITPHLPLYDGLELEGISFGYLIFSGNGTVNPLTPRHVSMAHFAHELLQQLPERYTLSFGLQELVIWESSRKIKEVKCNYRVPWELAAKMIEILEMTVDTGKGSKAPEEEELKLENLGPGEYNVNISTGEKCIIEVLNNDHVNVSMHRTGKVALCAPREVKMCYVKKFIEENATGDIIRIHRREA